MFEIILIILCIVFIIMLIFPDKKTVSKSQIDKEFIELYKESEAIIDKINKLLNDYKDINDYFNFGFVNKDFLNLLNKNKNKCKELGENIMRNTQKFVIFGETNAGKSTFINALIFQSNVLPTGSASTTKRFVEIMQSIHDTNYLEVDNRKEEFSKLEKIAKTVYKKENEEKVQMKINLFYNFKESDYFANNIIIDTPGTDFDEEYDKNILQYCNEADIVILVVNATNHIGKSMEKFCKKFEKDLSKLNLYVVFNYCDVLQENDDWEEGTEEKIKKLKTLIQTLNREKIAYVSSKERMEIMTKNEYIFKNENSKIRNDSFQKLSKQIQNERFQLSNISRCESLRNILEIIIDWFLRCDKEVFSQIMANESSFFDTNSIDLSSCIKDCIKKTVLSYKQKLIEKLVIFSVSEMHNFENTAREMENLIKEKVKTEIINYIDRNYKNDKDKLKLVMKNIYFPKIMDEIHFHGCGKILKSSKEIMKITGFAAGLGAILASAVAFPFISVGPVILTCIKLYFASAGGCGVGAGLGLIFSQGISNIEAEIRNYLEKFSDDLLNSFTEFEQRRKKYSDLPKRKNEISKKIDDYKIKLNSLQEKYCFNKNPAK